MLKTLHNIILSLPTSPSPPPPTPYNVPSVVWKKFAQICSLQGFGELIDQPID